MRVSKRMLLVVSVLLSTALHAALLMASPRITLLKPYSNTLRESPRFKVDLIVVPRPEPNTAAVERTGLVSRPGSIRDMLKRETDTLTPTDTALTLSEDLSRLQERLALERVLSPNETQPNEQILSEMDTRIIEISQENMRRTIEIARRLVSPSTTRILDENEIPVLRGTADAEGEEVLIFPTQLGGASVEPVRVPVPEIESASAAASAHQEPLESMKDEPPDLLRLEKEVAKAPVTQTIQSVPQKYDFIDDLVAISLEKYVPPSEPYGYFRLVIAPKKDAEIPPLPKEVMFVVDASTSITQRKLDKTVAGVLACLRALREEDLFNIVVFRDNPTLFSPTPVPATETNKRNGENFLKGAQARGQTNVYEGIRPVVQLPTQEGVPRIVILASDGRPTTGLTDARNVINALTEENQSRNSIFAFGAGNTVNRYLLDLLAYRNKGESYVAANIDQIPNELPKFMQRLNDPLLVDCTVDFGRLNAAEVFPKEIPDFYRGQAVTIYGRFDPKKDREFALRLVGKAGERRKEIVFRQDLQDASSGDDRIARTWAFRRIYHLIGEMCRVGETPELLNEIRSLSRKYNIRTVYD